MTDCLGVKQATGLKSRKNARESPGLSAFVNVLAIGSTARPNCFAEVYVNDKVLRTKVIKGTLNPCWEDSFEVCVC